MQLPPARLIRSLPRPIEIVGHVRVAGTAATESVIDANQLGQVFHLRADAELELSDVSVLRGRRVAAAPASQGSASFERVLAAEGPSNLAAGRVGDDAVEEYVRRCAVGTARAADNQYYRVAQLVDPTAMAAVPGDVL